jgi:putative hemolysin
VSADQRVDYPVSGLLVLVGWILHLSLTELIAPNVNQERALGHLRARSWLVRLFVALFSPLVNSIIKQKERIASDHDREDRKEEIVERAIESLAESAGIDEPLMKRAEREMIENVFELGQTEAREVMVPRIDMIAIENGSSFTEIQQTATESGYSRFPLYENDIDNIKGIIYLKDLFRAFPFEGGEPDLKRFARQPYFVPESKILSSLLEDFKRQHNHLAIVVDEFGGTAGLVTLEDLLEIIVGDIQDEHDTEEAELVKIDDKTYMVSANLSMEDLSEELDLKLEEKDFETVGGYIYDLVGSLPKVGQLIESEGLSFVVERISGQRIEKVKLTIASDRNNHEE